VSVRSPSDDVRFTAEARHLAAFLAEFPASGLALRSTLEDGDNPIAPATPAVPRRRDRSENNDRRADTASTREPSIAGDQRAIQGFRNDHKASVVGRDVVPQFPDSLGVGPHGHVLDVSPQ
jgi:hypothetical protein